MNHQNMQDTVSGEHQHNEAPRIIFRPDAVRRYMQQHEAVVLPPRIALRMIVVGWIALGLLLVGTAAIWMAHVPIYLSGNAIVVDQGSAGQPKPVLVAFLPPAARMQLAPGQSLLVSLDGVAYSRHVIMVVEPELISRDEAQRRYAPRADAPITEPAAVAIAPLASSTGVTVDAHHPVTVEVGTRRLISFLPLFHRTLPEQHP